MYHIPNDKRSRKSAALICEGLAEKLREKPYDQISITDVCVPRGIAQTTFYGHYEDIVALRRMAEQYPARMVLARMEAEQHWDVRRGIMVISQFRLHLLKGIQHRISGFVR